MGMHCAPIRMTVHERMVNPGFVLRDHSQWDSGGPYGDSTRLDWSHAKQTPYSNTITASLRRSN